MDNYLSIIIAQLQKSSVALLILIVFLSGVCACHAQAPLGNNPNFTSVKITAEQSVGEIVGITQDYKGFIWIVGSAGVSRYDGYRFHTYPAEWNPLGESFLSDIYEDSYNELWISSPTEGVARLDRLTDTFITYTYNAAEKNTHVQNRYERIYEDDNRVLWFVGLGGVTQFDRQNNKLVRFLDDTPIAEKVIYDMLQIAPNEYIFATNDGIYKWHKVTSTLQHIPPSDGANRLPSSIVRVLGKDSHGNIWVGHGNGLSQFYPASNTFSNIQIRNDIEGRTGISIWYMFIAPDDTVWLGTDGNGLVYYNPANETYGKYTKNNLSTSLGTTVVRSIYKDNLGDMWIGGYPTGLYHYDKSNNFVSLYSDFIRDPNDVFKNQVWAFVEDKNNNLWLGVDSLGLVYYDRKEAAFRREFEGIDLNDKNIPFSILSLFLDDKNNLWMGSWEQGISRFNLDTKSLTHFNPQTDTNTAFPANSVWEIYQSSNGNIYFGTMSNGLIRFDGKDDKFTQFRSDESNPNSIIDNTVWSILEDNTGKLWLATNEGISLFDPTSNTFKSIVHDPQNPESLASDRVMSFLQDSQNRIWVCTLKGGVNLFDPENNSFTHIQEKDGLISNDVKTIVEDNKGTMWISTNKGVSSYNPATGAIINYTEKNWLQKGEFSHGSSLKLQDGKIAFGGAFGFNIINPDLVSSNLYKPPLHLTELIVLNTPILARTKNPIIEKDILETDKITLNHKDSMISLFFTGLNYRVYQENKYQYKLLGFDKTWHYSRGETKAVYTRLGAGNYQFVVKAANNNDIWGEETILANIVVLPAPWLTWWAFGLYAVIIASLIAWYVAAQKDKIKRAEQLNKKLLELDKLKDDFLANTSHELRTPLNGIIGIAESMQEGVSGQLSRDVSQRLSMIVSCSRRLERMINNILDFAKVQKADFSLERECSYVYTLLMDVFTEVNSTAKSGQVHLYNRLSKKLPPVYCDVMRTQQIFYNLLSNALKFTEHGSVTITAHNDQKFVYVQVQDTGIGISEERRGELFSSFTQLSDSGAYTKSGIGLSLTMTKYFVELQGGTLTVESTEGKGSKFHVSLPLASKKQLSSYPTLNDEYTARLRQEVFQQAQNHKKRLPTPNQSREMKIPASFPPNYKKEKEHQHILVVDDEAINRMVLREMLLKQGYVVYEASNGQEFVEAINKGYRFDLVLLDIMMPKLSGMEACKQVREFYSPVELPIIFVSAKSQASDVVECFNNNGNDYLSKPVNREELLARVEAQLKITKRFRSFIA